MLHGTRQLHLKYCSLQIANPDDNDTKQNTAKLDQLLGVCGDHGGVVLVREQGEAGELQELLQEL